MKVSKLIKGAAIGGVLLAAKGLDNRLQTTHYTISSEKIPPEFDGFRIAQISDFHACSLPGVTTEIKTEKPDIIVMTGDLVHDTGSYEPGIRLASRLMEIAPVYSVTGNHDLRRSDYKQFQHALDLTGTITLHDETETLRKNGAQISLSGIEDPFAESFSSLSINIIKSIEKIPPTNNYHIVLFHRANHMNFLKDKGFDLVLSGHMHGGQFRLPGGRGICSPKSSWGTDTPMFFPKYFAGHYRSGDMDMIVNRGLGNTMLVPRLFNRPEITIIILKHKE